MIEYPDHIYRRARTEHAFMLRCEGLSYDEIGARISNTTPYFDGITKERARQLVREFAANFGRAMRRTRFRHE